MWHQTEHFSDDDIVVDGTACRERVTPVSYSNRDIEKFGKIQSRSSDLPVFPSHSHNSPFHSESGSTTVLPINGKSNQDSDSGFLSGAISGDLSMGLNTVSPVVANDLLNMKVKSAYECSDSGVDLNVSQPFSKLNLDSSSTPQNNLNSNPQTNINTHYQITLEDLIRQDEDGDTPLHLAILQGFIELVFSLVRLLPHPSLLEIANNVKQTPLHLAVLTNQAPLVRRLVVAGAHVELRDRYGNTPLHLASRLGYLDCVKALCIPIGVEERQTALLRHNFPPQRLPQDLEQRNYDGQMCIHLAAMNGHQSVVEHLFWFGANINAIEGKSGRTALHYAVERRQPILLSFLITHCRAQLEAETYSGYSAYQIASVTSPMLAELLAKLGAARRSLPPDTPPTSDTDESDDELPCWRVSKQKVLDSVTEALFFVA